MFPKFGIIQKNPKPSLAYANFLYSQTLPNRRIKSELQIVYIINVMLTS